MRLLSAKGQNILSVSLRSAHTMGLKSLRLFPATSRRDQSHRVNWPFLPQNLVTGTKIWSLRLDFEAKMASSHDATGPCDQSQGLVASSQDATSPCDLLQGLVAGTAGPEFKQTMQGLQGPEFKQTILILLPGQ